MVGCSWGVYIMITKYRNVSVALCVVKLLHMAVAGRCVCV